MARPTIQQIADATRLVCGITLDDLRGGSQHRKITHAKRVFAFTAKRHGRVPRFYISLVVKPTSKNCYPAQSLLRGVSRLSSGEKREFLRCVDKVLEVINGEPCGVQPPTPTLDEIIRAVVKATGQSRKTLDTGSKVREVVFARDAYVYLARTMTPRTYAEISIALHGDSGGHRHVKFCVGDNRASRRMCGKTVNDHCFQALVNDAKRLLESKSQEATR